MTRRPKWGSPPGESKLFVVDRREGAIVVLVGDDDASIEVKADLLPTPCRAEGAVLRVPIDGHGQPDWSDATRDRAEEARRIGELEKRAERMRRSDPGGDVAL